MEYRKITPKNNQNLNLFLEILGFLYSHKIVLPARRAILSVQPFISYMIDLGKETLLSFCLLEWKIHLKTISLSLLLVGGTRWSSTCPHLSSEHTAAMCNLQWEMCNVQCAMCTIHLSPLLSTEQSTICKSFSDHFLEFSIVVGSSWPEEKAVHPYWECWMMF